MSEEFEVSKIKKIRYNLYHVIFNEEIVQKFTDETMATFRVNQGTVFSKETYDEMVKNDQIKRAKSRGLDILSRSSKSKMQIKSTLKREGFCEEAIEHALEFLENYKFVDDQKLATDIAKNKASTKKWSKRQMVSKLMEKGISKNLIHQNTSQIYYEYSGKKYLGIAIPTHSGGFEILHPQQNHHFQQPAIYRHSYKILPVKNMLLQFLS